MVAREGIEPPTRGFSVRCSTNGHPASLSLDRRSPRSSANDRKIKYLRALSGLETRPLVYYSSVGWEGMLSASPISNVSDTARWVAIYRARESARPDALFDDPYAELLAGERGRAIATVMPRPARNGWPLIARTKLVDDFVLASRNRPRL